MVSLTDEEWALAMVIFGALILFVVAILCALHVVYINLKEARMLSIQSPTPPTYKCQCPQTDTAVQLMTNKKESQFEKTTTTIPRVSLACGTVFFSPYYLEPKTLTDVVEQTPTIVDMGDKCAEQPLTSDITYPPSQSSLNNFLPQKEQSKTQLNETSVSQQLTMQQTTLQQHRPPDNYCSDVQSTFICPESTTVNLKSTVMSTSIKTVSETKIVNDETNTIATKTDTGTMNATGTQTENTESNTVTNTEPKLELYSETGTKTRSTTTTEKLFTTPSIVEMLDNVDLSPEKTPDDALQPLSELPNAPDRSESMLRGRDTTNNQRRVRFANAPFFRYNSPTRTSPSHVGFSISDDTHRLFLDRAKFWRERTEAAETSNQNLSIKNTVVNNNEQSAPN